MTRTLASDVNNDLMVSDTGDLVIYDGLSAVAADCRSAMQAQRGEMVFAVDRGMPTLQTAWDRYLPAQFEAAARRAILRQPDVMSVESIVVTRESSTVRYDAVIKTVYGRFQSVPYNYLTTTGTIVPDASTVLAEVQSEWRAALGADLNVDPETPQGVLIVAEAQNRIQAAENNAALANQINPDVSGGIFLDSLCSLSGIARDAATRTQVSGVLLTGQPQTFIPAGSRARTANGDVFESVGSVQLDALGEGSVSFQSVEFGQIAASANSLNLIVDAVLGWETVNNPIAGVVGRIQQSDESLKSFRRNTLARQAMSVSEAVASDVYAVPNVRSLQFRENVSDTPATIDGILIGAHSVWVCVDGGTDEDIAAALLQSKTAGAGWTGAVSVSLVDPHSGQTYSVDFDRPEDFDVLCQVTVRRGTFVGDIPTAVRDALIAYANGDLPSDPGFVVGGDVSPFELAGAITRQVLGLYVAKVEIASPDIPGPITYQTTEIDLAINQVARITESSITVIEL